jgi:hypothetical protein
MQSDPDNWLHFLMFGTQWFEEEAAVVYTKMDTRRVTLEESFQNPSITPPQAANVMSPHFITLKCYEAQPATRAFSI